MPHYHAAPRYTQVSMSQDEIKDRVNTYLSQVRKSTITTEDILWSFPEMEDEPIRGRNRWKWANIKRAMGYILDEHYSDTWTPDNIKKPGIQRRWRRVL